MNSYEKQQTRESVYTLILALLVSGFLVFFCVIEKNYESLAYVVLAIAFVFFMGLGGTIAYYKERGGE